MDFWRSKKLIGGTLPHTPAHNVSELTARREGVLGLRHMQQQQQQQKQQDLRNQNVRMPMGFPGHEDPALSLQRRNTAGETPVK